MGESRVCTLTLAAALVLGFPSMFSAQAPAEPPAPQPRPDGLESPLVEQQLPISEAPAHSDEPEFGPVAPEPETEAGSDVEPEPQDPPSPEPEDTADGEVARVYRAACPALLTGRVVGEMVDPLSEGTCGLQSPIAVNAVMVNGREIALTGTPIVNCAMATTLADWAEEVDRYATATLDTQIESLATGPGYQCRLRNNADMGFVSEHGLGNAADITGFNFADGSRISVLDDWSVAPLQPDEKFLGFAHSAACGRFTTVLGPEANSAHADHFHFDLGCHGQSCTAQICE